MPEDIPATALSDWLVEVAGVPQEYHGRLVASLVAILALWALRKIAYQLIIRGNDDVRFHYRWRKNTGYAAAAVGVVIVGRMWFEGVGSLTVYFGLVSAGIAVAMQDPLVNLAGWAFILTRRPFEVGDRIEIGECRGDVIDQRMFMFSLVEVGNWVNADQSTGRVIHIPNGRVFRESMANYSQGFRYIWDEIPVVVTFESDWRKAKELLLEIAARHTEHLSKEAELALREAAERYMIFFNKLTPTVYTSVVDHGVMLTIRYLCEPRRRRNRQQAIWEDALDAFNTTPTIDFAYPTHRIMNDPVPPRRPRSETLTP